MVIVFVLNPHYSGLQQDYGKDSVEYTKDFAGKMVESFSNRIESFGIQSFDRGNFTNDWCSKENSTTLEK